MLEDGERRPLGLVTVNPASKIIARMLDRDPEAVIDQAWFAARLARALALRDAAVSTQPFYRLVHAEADGLPGVVIDRFGDMAVVQPNAAWAEAHLDALVAALIAVTGVTHVIKNGSGRSRALEGLAEETLVLHGAAPEAPVPVPMNGAIYHGRPCWAGRRPGCSLTSATTTPLPRGWRGARGCWMCSPMSAALGWRHWRAGRRRCWRSIPVGAGAGAGRGGAAASGFADRFETRAGDAFAVLEALGGRGRAV